VQQVGAVAGSSLGLSPTAQAQVAQTLRTGVRPQGGRLTARGIWLLATILLTLGSLAGAVALAPSASASPDRGLGWLLFLGSSVHVASTGWFYTLPEVRSYAGEHPGRYVYAPICLVAIAAVVAAIMPPSSFAWLLLPYFGWQLLHFQKQNLGMAALAATSRGIASLRPLERRALTTAGLAGIPALVARPSVLQLRVDPGLMWLRHAGLALFIGAVAAGVLALARRPRSERPAGFCVVYATSLCFALPVFVFRSPYAAVGGMTIAHGLQYLLLVGMVATGVSRGRIRLIRLAAFGNVALIGGIALNAASHLHSGGTIARSVFGAYLGAVMAHFVVDAGLWRLRDQFPRRFLSANVPYLVPQRHKIQSSVDDRSATDI
jgi:hypothetical protein